ncbi:MAG: DUF4870 domain-containing protein [Fimbriimonas ginsengisoli]|uniref:DUF4870 domain-containing protein n=1 Tax=Fimbriimonas ginsengisoli TaxID=1005039 RepID=A0A931LS55_FIMGI|nr:DUF4870 domain-containing protein [Fimbriimonas ginsengisoli]
MNNDPEPGAGKASEPEVAGPSKAQASQPAKPSGPSITPSGGGMVSQEDKGQATLVWVLTIFFGFIPGLIFFLVAKDKPFVHKHATQALGFEIFIAIAYVASWILAFVLIGFILMPLIWIFHIVITIMGAVAANKGEEYTPPIAGGLTKAMFKT